MQDPKEGMPSKLTEPKSVLPEGLTSDSALVLAGYLFIILALGALTGMAVSLYRAGLGDMREALKWADVLQVFFAPLMLFVIAIFSSLLGFSMLQISGRPSRRVIHPDDYKLLSEMLLKGNHAGIDDWIRLSSLTGIIGGFTKVGMFGLPLATIILTIGFAGLAVVTIHWPETSKAMFDLSKLTLGAFIGSFVQRQTAEHGGSTGHQAGQSGAGKGSGGGSPERPV